MNCKHPDGCVRPVKGHGWCRTHLDRIRTNGEPGPATISTPLPLSRPCRHNDCDRSVTSQGGFGFCGMHYQRFTRQGSPDVVGTGGASLKQDANPRWSGNEATYDAVHQRLRIKHGRAGDLLCVDCGSRAAHWSYDNADLDERVDERYGRYSTDLDHYEPRCVPCHSVFDKSARALMTGARP